MPLYDYYCSDCKSKFYVMHAMSEKCEECAYCQSENVERMIANISYDIDPNNYKKKVGDLVKTHIEEAKKDVKEQKKNMSKEMLK